LSVLYTLWKRRVCWTGCVWTSKDPKDTLGSIRGRVIDAMHSCGQGAPAAEGGFKGYDRGRVSFMPFERPSRQAFLGPPCATGYRQICQRVVRAYPRCYACSSGVECRGATSSLCRGKGVKEGTCKDDVRQGALRWREMM
jgi:hypothetical protein